MLSPGQALLGLKDPQVEHGDTYARVSCQALTPLCARTAGEGGGLPVDPHPGPT